MQNREHSCFSAARPDTKKPYNRMIVEGLGDLDKFSTAKRQRAGALLVGSELVIGDQDCVINSQVFQHCLGVANL